MDEWDIDYSEEDEEEEKYSESDETCEVNSEAFDADSPAQIAIAGLEDWDGPVHNDITDQLEKIDNRWQRLAAQRNKLLEKLETMRPISIDSEEPDPALLEIDLHEINVQLRRLNTRAEMLGMDLTYNDLGELSDDANHIVQDDEHPEDRRIRKMFRSLPYRGQEYALNRAVEDDAISEEEADWYRKNWR
ncbi:hypothetical protein BVX94_02805 [bacterium B17]|nr:hypothetical protein BVX94_02805 [bacterium B17]